VPGGRTVRVAVVSVRAVQRPPERRDRVASAAVTRRDTVLLLVLSAIWGSSFMFIKIGVEDVAPSVIVFGRLAIGSLVLVPVALSSGGIAPLRGRLPRLLVLAAFGTALPFWLLSFAGGRIDSGLSAEIQASAPLATVILARWLDRTQTLRGLRLIGIGVGFVGTALLVGGERGGELVGALAVVGTATCYAVAALLTGRWFSGVPSQHIAAGQMGLAALITAPAAIVQAPDAWPGWDTAGSILSLGILGTGAAYLIYFALIQTAGATRAILVTYLVPGFALVYGALFVDESVTLRALAGLALILGGTAAATGSVGFSRWTRRRAP
jgi:drug/metabolite transporter (DMT)-like permease